MNAAKKNGGTLVGIATVPHPRFDEQIIAEEYKHFGDIPPDINAETKSAIAASFDYIIAQSELTRDTYIQNGFPEDRIWVAPLDVDTEQFKPQPKRDDVFRVTFLSDIHIKKGLHYLLAAWQRLSIPNSELLIVGRMNVPDKVEQEYREIIESDESIYLLKHTDTPEEIYRDTSVFVLPSLSEGFGKVVNEAMASGLPVVTTEHAPGLITNGEDGFIVPIRDSNALAERIQYLYDNPLLARRVGERGRVTVQKKDGFGERVTAVCKAIYSQAHSSL
jgi:glycosyltransferase involved in cell wall biosynthesis